MKASGLRALGAGAVMVNHAPAVVETDDALTALYRKLEFFPTPIWAARAGGELIKRLDPQASRAWEPCVGQGHMHHGLQDYFGQVYGSDIHDHGTGYQLVTRDFLSAEADELADEADADWIVTNPPFKPAAEFVRVGLRRARRGVAIFARSGWLETIGRCDLFYPPGKTLEGLTVEAPFFERVPLALGGWDPDGSTATPYSWFLFMHGHVVPPGLISLRQALGESASLTIPIRPGTEARLTRPDDARMFGRVKPMPLFEGEV